VKFASIGPVTSEVARKHGLPIAAEAAPHTVDGLIDAIVKESL
jgi:uroporphyrinogen-III synthase